MGETHKGLPVLTFWKYEDWLAWLEANHASVDAVWLKLSKKASPKQTISYVEAREGALIYGWIDGLMNPSDEYYRFQRFTPRRAKSVWSKVNRGLVEELAAQGKMKPSGTAQVKAAQADGRWDAAYDPPATMGVPGDFQAALNANPAASACFAEISKTNRYAILFQIHHAKRPETRARRIAKYVQMLSEGQRLY